VDKIGSLCSGIGGLELGLERAGLGEVVFQVEISEILWPTLKAHWPDAKLLADVKDVTAESVPAIDGLCVGFPCQPVSYAGDRNGADDDRWLWPQVIRIINELKPKWIVIENVPGLRTRGLRTVLADLAESGFDADWRTLRAQDVGAAHKRERLFIVAYPNSMRQLQSEGGVFSFWRWDIDAFGWPAEPKVDRVAYGLPGWVVKTLGNAVVPAVAESVGAAFRRWRNSICP
jgi:DNA (cytosine-5)-methyltransferase 1